jgi:hypothetical protein
MLATARLRNILLVIDEPTFAKGKTLLHRIVSMLVKMST